MERKEVRILVLDDEPMMTDSLKQNLVEEGYTVDTASSGAEAIELFDRGVKYLFFAQQATSDKQGDVWAEWVLGLPEDERPKTAAYPTLDDPFTVPTSEGIEAILKEAGVETVYRKTYPADTTNFDSIAGSVKAANPELVVLGNQFEDGVGMQRRHPHLSVQFLAQSRRGDVAGQEQQRVGADGGETRARSPRAGGVV